MDDFNQVLRARHEKLDALREKGIEPFAHSYIPSHRSNEVILGFEELEALERLAEGGEGEHSSVAGRILSWRDHGKSHFAHIGDAGGSIQVYFKSDIIGDECFEELNLLDLGDWIGVEGRAFRTRTGEITIRAESYTLLTKSLRPLPFGKTEENTETGISP